jgi:hypothetical protein
VLHSTKRHFAGLKEEKMKYRLAFLLLVASIAGAVAPVARADTLYELRGITSSPFDNLNNIPIIGSYELNSHGQIVGPWGFEWDDAAVGGNGMGGAPCEPFCFYPIPYVIVSGGSGFFDSGRSLNDPETLDSWVQLSLGRGPVGGSFQEERDCTFPYDCGPAQGSFTGFVTVEHVPEPEPSSLLLTGIGLLGIAAFCSLRRRPWAELSRVR